MSPEPGPFLLLVVHCLVSGTEEGLDSSQSSSPVPSSLPSTLPSQEEQVIIKQGPIRADYCNEKSAT